MSRRCDRWRCHYSLLKLSPRALLRSRRRAETRCCSPKGNLQVSRTHSPRLRFAAKCLAGRAGRPSLQSPAEDIKRRLPTRTGLARSLQDKMQEYAGRLGCYHTNAAVVLPHSLENDFYVSFALKTVELLSPLYQE